MKQLPRTIPRVKVVGSHEIVQPQALKAEECRNIETVLREGDHKTIKAMLTCMLDHHQQQKGIDFTVYAGDWGDANQQSDSPRYATLEFRKLWPLTTDLRILGCGEWDYFKSLKNIKKEARKNSAGCQKILCMKGFNHQPLQKRL